METQNTQTKMTNESPVYIDEVDIFHPVADETARLREELEAEHDKYLRLAAEYENYRRRTKREQATAAEQGRCELLLHLLSLADDFDLAFTNLDDASDEKIVKGLQLIERRLKSVLKINNVVAFDSAGEIFNPELHEAFDIVSDTEKGSSGRVHSQLRHGYFWNDKLLRPALVITAQ